MSKKWFTNIKNGNMSLDAMYTKQHENKSFLQKQFENKVHPFNFIIVYKW